MDPSHARRYRNFEIEVFAAKILNEAYPTGVSIPIDIDWLAESNYLVDDIVPATLLEDRFKVAAVLMSKHNGHFDILVDEDTLNLQRARANFSIAHELGHVVLHTQVCGSCHTIEDSIVLRNRITKAYSYIERDANYFAGEILMPRRNLPEDAAKLYEGLVKLYGYEGNLIPSKLCSRLAERYKVNPQPMEIRLRELNLRKKVLFALRSNCPFLDP
ncbi:MAG TPA: ImmA/IrrE family metallo-endopeptidase [Sedimentisphaerales bacterium]|nr:ImmA/IrrE family metallo-endopeptidase [Sedimentisphaerales bacterium]